jgi:AcrR family transcriptional regulator
MIIPKDEGMEKINRKVREHLTHRHEILLAAEKLFAAKGFFPTTMSKIAQEAQFGTGTLYKYFKSKEDLYFTLIDEKTAEINDPIRAEFSKKMSAIERIEKILRIQFEFIEKNRDFFRIYISERSRFEWTVKDDLGKGLHEKMVAYIHLLAQVMKQGIKNGTFKPKDPMDLAHALVGIVNSFIFEWLIAPRPYPLLSKVDTVLDIFLKGAQRTERRR